MGRGPWFPDPLHMTIQRLARLQRSGAPLTKPDLCWGRCGITLAVVMQKTRPLDDAPTASVHAKEPLESVRHTEDAEIPTP